MKDFSENYILSGGTRDFSEYYTANYNLAKFDDRLKSKMIVATHNLVSDRSFNEFQLILCRNVLIYFDKYLQDKVFTLFDDSLENSGFLVLGSKEHLRFSSIASNYLQLDKEKIWRKTR
jgi:chemotaxis protein methyltransferase CheR